MLLDEYDYETDIEVQREEAREQGREEGRKQGREEGRKAERSTLIQKKLEKGKTISQIADELEDTEENIACLIEQFYVPTDFDTKEKAFFGAKAAEKDLKQGLPRSYSDFGSPCFMCLVILLPLGNAAGYQPCGVAILE